jgi:hypothetical protein
MAVNFKGKSFYPLPSQSMSFITQIWPKLDSHPLAEFFQPKTSDLMKTQFSSLSQVTLVEKSNQQVMALLMVKYI